MRKRRISPTHLCLKFLRARGWTCEVVEKYVKTPMGGFRRDAFGADILAISATDIIGVQAGAATDHAAKIKKAIALPEVREWLRAPTRLFQIWTWKQRPAFSKGGGRKKRDEWKARVTQLVLRGEDIIPVEFTLKQ